MSFQWSSQLECVHGPAVSDSIQKCPQLDSRQTVRSAFRIGVTRTHHTSNGHRSQSNQADTYGLISWFHPKIRISSVLMPSPGGVYNAQAVFALVFPLITAIAVSAQPP